MPHVLLRTGGLLSIGCRRLRAIITQWVPTEPMLLRLAEHLRCLLEQRNAATDVAGALDAHTLTPVLTSILRIEVRNAPCVLIEVERGYNSASHEPGQLRQRATCRSGRWILGLRAQTQQQSLPVIVLAHRHISTTFYDPSRQNANAALICLTRRCYDGGVFG